jgi:hypothetical protein
MVFDTPNATPVNYDSSVYDELFGTVDVAPLTPIVTPLTTLLGGLGGVL